jgi:hypothetical protein
VVEGVAWRGERQRGQMNRRGAAQRRGSSLLSLTFALSDGGVLRLLGSGWVVVVCAIALFSAYGRGERRLASAGGSLAGKGGCLG